MLFLAIVLLGGISYARLPIDLLPDVSYPRLVIYTAYEEVAPAEVERRVTEPIEGAAAAVPGVEWVTSTSRYGVSLVTLRFAWGTDMDFAMLNVRERMDNVRELLPETVSRPTILRVDPASDPIMTLSVSGGQDLWQTKELSETVFRRRLEQLDGVAQAAVTGGLDREIRVEVEPRLLDSYGLTIEEISAALDGANVSAPGGTILQGRYRYPLRTLGEFQTVEEIGDVVVARQSVESGVRVVRLADVGPVVDGFAEPDGWGTTPAAEKPVLYFLPGMDGSLSTPFMQYCELSTTFELACMQHVGGLVPWSALPYADLCMDDACGGDAYHGTPACDTALLNAEIEARNASGATGWQMVALGADYEELMRVALVKNGPIAQRTLSSPSTRQINKCSWTSCWPNTLKKESASSIRTNSPS